MNTCNKLLENKVTTAAAATTATTNSWVCVRLSPKSQRHPLDTANGKQSKQHLNMQVVSRTRGWPAKTKTKKKKEKLLLTLLSPYSRSQPRHCLNTSTVWASVDVPNSVSISDNATAASIVSVLLLLTYFLPLSLSLSYYLPHSYLFEPACSAVGFLLNPRLLCWLTLALVHNTSRQCNMAKARLLGNNIKCRTTSWTLHHPLIHRPLPYL